MFMSKKFTLFITRGFWWEKDLKFQPLRKHIWR